jgi:pyruvate,water dikinase
VEHSRPLAELRRADEARFGGKSASLGELLAAGIPVPPGFALCTSAMPPAGPRAGRESIRAAPVPDPLRDEIARRYAELADAAGESPPVAVRSSAIGEDSAQATFAGQLDSYLWVRGAADVCDAVRDCWASLYSPRALSYRDHLARADDDAAMGVTIQLMVDAVVAGVMFTCNPVSGDPSMVAINASWGLGPAVVGGEVTPDDYLVSKVTGEVVREQINTKEIEYLPAPDGAGTTRVDVSPERRDVPCLDEPTLARLVDVARHVERVFGSHQDVEWAIRRSDGELFVVQSRPVTTLPERRTKAPASALSLVMSQFGVPKGS